MPSQDSSPSTEPSLQKLSAARQVGAGILLVVGMLMCLVAVDGFNIARHGRDGGYVVAFVFGAAGVGIIAWLGWVNAKYMHREDREVADMAPAPGSEVKLDSGTGLFVLAVIWFILIPVAYAKLSVDGHPSKAAWIAIGYLLLLSAVTAGLGAKRRSWFRANGGTRPAPVVPVPRQPVGRVNDPRTGTPGPMREPAINTLVGAGVLAASGGLLIEGSSHGMPLELGLFIGLLFGPLSIWILSVGIRRMIWFAAYMRACGEPPW